MVGIAVGGLYGLLKFRSPAPPLIALIGLLGMLYGEQIIATAWSYVAGDGGASRLASTGADDALYRECAA